MPAETEMPRAGTMYYVPVFAFGRAHAGEAWVQEGTDTTSQRILARGQMYLNRDEAIDHARRMGEQA